MSLLFRLPNALKLALAATVVIGMGALYLQHRAAIYREGYDDAMAEVRKEQDLQDAANLAAMRMAERRYVQAIDALALEKDRLNDALSQIDQDAAADSGAQLCGIGADSVRRLNSIR